MSTLLLNPVSSGFGHVTFNGVATYSRVTTAPISLKKTVAGTNEKATFASFDHSSLPVGCTIKKVELLGSFTAFPVSGEVNVLTTLVAEPLSGTDAALYASIASGITLATRAAAVGAFTQNLGASGVSNAQSLFESGDAFTVGWKYAASGYYELTLGVIPQLRITYDPPSTGNPPADESVTIAQHASGSITWPFYDADGNSRDLTGESLRLLVFDARTNAVVVNKDTEIDPGGLSITGNSVSVTYDEDDSATADTYRYCLWVIGDSDELIRQGHWTVSATVKDAPS